jgi:hypothetical protein
MPFPRAQAPLVVVAAILLGACADDEPAHASLLDPPPAGQGTQVVMNTTIEPGVEAEHCRFVRAPAEGLWLNRDEVRYTAGSHHVLLYETAYDDIPSRKEDGTEVDTSGVFDCSDGATNGWRIRKLIGGSQNQTGESVLSFPDDVAMRVAPGAVLLLNVHLINTSSEVEEPEVRMNLHTIPERDVRAEGDILFLYNPLIKVPNRGSSRARWRCPVHADITIANVQSHMHARGVGYSAGVAGEAPFYENDRWEGVPVKHFDGGLEVRAGSVIDYHCDFQNLEPRDVYQGPRTTDEMCMVIGSYYPADPRTANCLDERGEDLAGEWVGDGSKSCAETLGCLMGAFEGDDVLRGITDCMLEADPKVARSSSDLVRCFMSSDDPASGCQGEIAACSAE